MEMVNDYKWHCDYLQLAWDSGFSFGKYQYSNIDKYKICLVDIERIIRERDVASVENQIPTILQYNLDNEQANVLDQNFVKIFRISQLSVEYLLFCKKYLDGLVITMKKQIDDLTQEKKEMKSYVEKLESHLSSINLTSTFKCDKCPKVFSSENYLTAHFKRRHDEENIMKKSSENEQLHSELRELKERLNVAEKNLKHKKDEPESEKLKIEESSSKYIDEIQKSFGMFKDQVENKIEHLKSEREFLNEKYDKMFDALLQFKNKGEENVKEEKNTKESPVEIQTIEHTTQTENYNKTRNLEIQTITNIDTSQTKETNEEITAIKGTDEIDNLVEQKIHAFGDNIENKISDGLSNIQNQMKQLCEKLLQLEANQNISRRFGEMVNMQTSTIDNKFKPMIKPRTKLSKPTTLVKTASNCNETEKLKTELNKMLSTKTVPKSQLELTSESVESEMDSIIIQKKEPKVQKVQPKLTKVFKKENEKNNSNVASQVERKIEQVKCEINDALLVKLQEMSISPHWKGLPKKSFEKALDIIKHQASQNKKYFPDYDKLKKLIEHSMKLGNELKSIKPKQDSKEPSLIRIGYRKKHNHKALKEGPESEPAIKPVVSIKNRSLYDTDSEIEQLENNLKVMKTENTDSDLKSLDLSDEDRKIETKSALKTYPSDGSLVKKKVLFSMEKSNTSVDGITVENSETSLSDLQIS